MQPAVLALERQGAMLDFEEGRLPEAEEALDGLLQRLRDGSDPAMRYELCRTLLDRATVRRYANRWRDAREDLNECEKIASTLLPVSSRALLVNVYQQRAQLYAVPDSPLRDAAAVNEEVARLRALGFTNWWVQHMVADLAYQEGRWADAVPLYRDLAAELEREGWVRGAMACRLRTGRALIEQARWDEAAPWIGAALAFFEEHGPPDLLAAAQIQSARLLSAGRQAEAAWEKAQSALSLVEAAIRQFRALYDQQQFVRDKLAYYRWAFAIGLAGDGDTGLWRAWQVAERAKSFYLCQLVANADVPLFEGVDPDALAKLQELEASLDDREARWGLTDAPETRAQLHEEIAALSRERDALLNNLMRAHPRWAAVRNPPPLDVRQALESLPEGWAALSYFWQEQDGDSRLHLFFAGRQDRPGHAFVDWSVEEIGELEKVRRSLQQAPSENLPMMSIFPSRLIAKALPDALVDWLKDQDSLLISPHGSLRTVPLHALPLKTGQPLIEQISVQYVPTLALLPLAGARKPEPRVLVLGCEQDGFSEGKAKLPGVLPELGALRAIWKDRPGVSVTVCHLAPEAHLGGSAPEPARWGEYGLLHFSCHGVFDPVRPMDAALRLGSDAVRAAEFFGLRLNAALASLSACDLGGQAEKLEALALAGDEWLGLYIPLFYAGAQTVLVSLWKAMDEEAAKMMETLHRALSEGKTPAEAFRQAAASIQSHPPAHWANWYLAGVPASSLWPPEPQNKGA
jgi:CHAT domain-containing protein